MSTTAAYVNALDVDTLARMTRVNRDNTVAGLDAEQLTELAVRTRARAAATPDGPQRRRLERAGTSLSNKAIVRVLDDDRAARIAAGENPRQHVWDGMRGAKRGKVHGQDYRVGDTIRVPARAICGAQRKGFTGRILAEGEHSDCGLTTLPDGSRVGQIAMMRPGSPVFHVRRFDDGRVVEVPKPPPGRQRGNTIELYRPDAAPADPWGEQ